MNAIVAVNSDWGIGLRGMQQVVIAEDRRYFKELTEGCAVIVGRRTFESFGGPLPNRRNIVLTRDVGYMAEGAIIAHSPSDAISKASYDDPCKQFVIGGGSVYELFLPLCDYVYVTKIKTAPLSDTFFPVLDNLPDWELMRQGEAMESGGVCYSFDIYKRLCERVRKVGGWRESG